MGVILTERMKNFGCWLFVFGCCALAQNKWDDSIQ